MDRSDWIYRSGDVFLPPSVRSFLKEYWIGDDTSLFYITNWTFVHMISGIITGYILLNYFSKKDYYITGFILHTVWEFWQILIGMTKIRTLRGQIDTIVDTISFMFGMILLKKLAIKF